VLAWLSVWKRDADLHMAQLMPFTVSCFSKIRIGFTFLVPAHLGSPGKRAVKRVCACVCVWGPAKLRPRTWLQLVWLYLHFAWSLLCSKFVVKIFVLQYLQCIICYFWHHTCLLNYSCGCHRLLQICTLHSWTQNLLSAGILHGAEKKLKAEWKNGVSVTLQPALPALAMVILIFCWIL